MFKVIYGSILIQNYWYPIRDTEREEWYFTENSNKFKSLNIRFDKEVVILIIDGIEEHYNSISCIPRLNELMEGRYKDV